jgi:molybdopterin molybdotransferase
VKQALARLPGVELWRVGMRPGQPQAFGVLDGGKLFFGLPGNPVSSAVVFEMLVRPALWAMMGRAVLDRPTIQARMLEPLSSKLGRRDFLRVILQPAGASSSAGDGPGWQARLTGSQSSGALSSIHRASGFAVVPEELDSVPLDTIVTVIDATQGVARQ